ncbi:MAG TPA: penicillin-binding protein activator [Steroidobacteraceae bacterium]|nr:penicillin-binding protein activator [Steroidobacteraceae bacterium]
MNPASMQLQITHRQLIRHLIIIVLAGLFASQVFAGSTTSTVDQATAARMADEAEQFAAQDNYAEASSRYEALAAKVGKADRDHMILKAAWYAVKANDIGRAQTLLDSTNKTLLGADSILRISVNAALALRSNDPDRAISLLDQIPLPIPDDAAPDVLGLRCQALFASGRIVLAVNTALERERSLKTALAITRNHQMIWNSLKQAAAAGRDLTPPSGASHTVAGWMELAKIFNNDQHDPFAFNRAVTDWRSRYPGHPGSDFIVVNSVATAPPAATGAGNNQIALLLPLTGRQQAAGIAIRDGFLTAVFQQNAAIRPVVRVYDTEISGALVTYKRAVADGASVIVGPLLKEDVQAIATSQAVTVPTLALNNTADGTATPQQFFQFSLDPEDEARQVAMRAIADGKTRAIVLVPNNEWGQRMQRAFTTELQTRGGSLVEARAYDPAARDYVDLVTQLLAPRNPAPKPKELENALGAVPASKVPEHRDDFDFVFIAAQAAQAKQLRPALRFMMPDLSVPVYATSDAFDPFARSNTDLEGLRFDDMPWIIDRDARVDTLYSSINHYWPAGMRMRARLYAFGVDAFTLLDVLKAARPQLVAPLRGMTGLLAVDQTGHVRRQLEWAQIVKGQLQLLPEVFSGN